MVVNRVLPDLNDVLCSMIFQMFGQSYKNDLKSFQEVPLPPCKDYIILMQFNGPEFEGELIITVDSMAAEDLISKIGIAFDDPEKKRALLHSALGELANVVAGHLMTYPSFKKIYGDVHLHPPVVWDAKCEEACIPVREGMSGTVLHDGTSIQTFISCTPVNSIDINVRDYTSESQEVINF